MALPLSFRGSRRSRGWVAAAATHSLATRQTRRALAALPALLLLLIGLVVLPSPAAAAEPPGGLTTEWTVAETTHFRFFVQANARMTADDVVSAYGDYAERAYEELSLLFQATANRKIAVYVYGDTALFDAAVTAMDRREIPGIEAIADPERLDLSIALPRFVGRSELEAENQIRHATAHILVGIASDFKIPRGFDEGIAQYVERPNLPKLARMAAIVQTAHQRGTLVSWSELNRDVPPQVDEELIAAEAYSVVAFLIQHYGLPEFQNFLVELRSASGWRDAMKTAYAPSNSDTLWKQWREKVPIWATSDWKWNLVAGFDLEPARQLLANGNYRAAQDRLELSEQLFRALDDTRRREEVEMLRAQSTIGIHAEELMADTQQALERHTYDRAASLLAQAQALYDQLPPDHRPDDLLATYEELATAGSEATARLELAVTLSHSWGDYPKARAAAREAGTTFARLGDEEMTARAQTLLNDLDTRQRRLVLMLGALAVLTLAWLALWLWTRGPSELQWE